MENTTFSIEMTAKQIRKFGFDLGYGTTMGVFSAIFMVNLGRGIYKAIKKHSEKKIKNNETNEESAEE